MLAAQEAARLAEEELKLAHERAEVAEAKIQAGRNIFLNKLLRTGLVIFIGYLLIFISVGIINRRVKELKVKHILRKNFIYLINLLMLLFILFVWLQNISSITIILSAIGAGLALALQEVLLSMAGWFLILIRKPFEVGDRIELGGIKGDVIDIRLFQTSLLEIGNWVDADQSTGRIANIPNSAIFKKENFNYSRGFEFIWNEIRILVTFESDYKRAEEIMMRHASKEEEGMESIVKKKIDIMTNQYMIYYDKLTPIIYANIKESGVELTLRYLTEARMRRATQDRLCRAILDDFEKEERVNFAYPTYRIVK
ncbi:MAG: mechanosensitive ion channel [Candidatus Omnitrophica bacterium]|nr:mechanosensitive ion channel [Candidatus Omnitrophota bacterium]